MARDYTRKLKILYLRKILQEETDAEHRLTMKEILDRLHKEDILASRESIYEDIHALREFGGEDEVNPPGHSGYYTNKRVFELSEIKLLIDSVQASRFITEKQSRELTKKLGSLCSTHQARELFRQTILKNRIKNTEDGVLENLDAIHLAIARNVQIKFRYTKGGAIKGVVKKTWKQHTHSPFAVIYTDQLYYMLAYDKQNGEFRHYRVDRMSGIGEAKNIIVTKMPRHGTEEFAKLDMTNYLQRTFSMFAGTPMKVEIQFPNSLSGVVVDRFGRDGDVFASKVDANCFKITVEVAVSKQFFGWLVGLGPGVEILSPQSVRDEMTTLLKDVGKPYGKQKH